MLRKQCGTNLDYGSAFSPLRSTSGNAKKLPLLIDNRVITPIRVARAVLSLAWIEYLSQRRLFNSAQHLGRVVIKYVIRPKCIRQEATREKFEALVTVSRCLPSWCKVTHVTRRLALRRPSECNFDGPDRRSRRLPHRRHKQDGPWFSRGLACVLARAPLSRSRCSGVCRLRGHLVWATLRGPADRRILPGVSHLRASRFVNGFALTPIFKTSRS